MDHIVMESEEDGAAATPRNLGGSLPVPNVQDLAARIIHRRHDIGNDGDDDDEQGVLRRYLRADDDESSAVVVNTSDEDEDSVPVVDLGRLLDPELGREEAGKLRSACEDWGFFQVVNHGVPDKVVDDMKDDLQRFFELPLEEKRAFAQRPGWIEGYGQAFVVSEEQTLDYSDMYFLLTQPPEYRDLKLWPSSNPSTFRHSLERYSAEVQRVARDLLRAMAKNLGLEEKEEELTRIAASQSVRMNYYPPCPQAHADKVLGISPHSDAVGLTLLLQASPVAGLQIIRGEQQRRWVPVAPLPGALIANVGDVIEVLTNGKYRSIEHRAVVSATHERISMAAFHTAGFGDTYGPIHEVVRQQSDVPRYRTISVEEYVKLVTSSKLDGKNIMDAMKINPHPESDP